MPFVLQGCSNHYLNSTKVPDKYKPKKLNPDPQYFMTVKGFIDEWLHSWFEERGLPCCLLVFSDDVTSHLVALHFVKVDSFAR